jgi:hypothetical protein
MEEWAVKVLAWAGIAVFVGFIAIVVIGALQSEKEDVPPGWGDEDPIFWRFAWWVKARLSTVSVAMKKL